MILIIIIILLVKVDVFYHCQVLLSEYNQCSNANTNQCKPGLKCQKKDEWYSQCLKYCPEKWDCNINLLTNNNLILKKEYEQCGGDNYKGSSNCLPGLTCFKNNKWYSQCLKRCPCGWQCCTNEVDRHSIFLPVSINNNNNEISQLSKFICELKYGVDYNEANADYSKYDFISLWLGKINVNCDKLNSKNFNCTNFDVYYGRNEINYLLKVKSLNKIAVFKSFIIGYEAANLLGLNEFNLSSHGAMFIRDNTVLILEKYKHFILRIQHYLSKTSSPVFIIEHNFWYLLIKLLQLLIFIYKCLQLRICKTLW